MKIKLFDVLLYVGVLVLVELIGLNFLKVCYLPAQAPFTFDIRVYGLLIATPAALICDTIGDITDFSHRELFLAGSIFCILALYAYLISFGCLATWKWMPQKRYKRTLVISLGVALGGFVSTWLAQEANLEFVSSVLLFPYQCISGYVSMVINIIAGNHIFLVEQVTMPLWGICCYWALCGTGLFYLFSKQRLEKNHDYSSTTSRSTFELIALRIVGYVIGVLIGGVVNVIIILHLVESSNKLLMILGSIFGFPAFLVTTGVARVIESCLNTHIDCEWIFSPLLFLWGAIYGISSCSLIERIIKKYLPRKLSSTSSADNSLAILPKKPDPIKDYGIWISCIVLDLLGGVLILIGAKNCLLYIFKNIHFHMDDFLKYFFLIIIGCVFIGIGLCMGKKRETKKTDSETP